MASTKFKCPYCGKEFTRERTLQVHMCEPKRRHLQKNEKWVQNAFIVFQRFYQIHQHNTKEKTYDEFCKSSYWVIIWLTHVHYGFQILLIQL